MADNLVKFLGDLAADPVALYAYRKDPEAAMSAAGLSEDSKAALRTQQRASVLSQFAAVAPQLPKAPGDNTIVIVVVA